MSSTNVPAPPRPSTVGRVVNEDPARVVNEQRTVVIRFRWHTLLTVIAAAVIGFAVGVSTATPMILGLVGQ